jgi:HlyD family secretion protein
MQPGKLLFLISLLAVSLLAGCNSGSAGGSLQATPADSTVQAIESVVSATGQVRPARWASLSFPISGRVSAVHVSEGQEVEAGQPVLDVEAVQLERAVAEARAALTAADAELARIRTGAHPQDVAAAESAVAAAQANVTAAEAQVAAAKAEEERARSGVTIAQAQVAIVQAGTRIAEAELSRAQAGASPQEVAVARAALGKAQAAVRLAQAEYDRVGGGSDMPQALALEQATLDLEMAQAEYDCLVAGPRASDLAPLRANVEAARAQVPLAEAQVTQAEDLVVQAETAVAQARAGEQVAQAQVAQAQASLDRLLAGPTSQELAVAEAAVTRAREALVTAEAALAEARLVAPLNGTVSLIQVRLGEEVVPGQEVLVLGDLDTLRVETTDLDEIDIARVQPGQRVDLTFDALPEKVLPGRVTYIAPMATPGQSAITYRTVIELLEVDPALRWGMTAFVDIRVE